VSVRLPARVAFGVLRALGDAQARARGLEARVCGEAGRECMVRVATVLRSGGAGLRA
jgi:hypothetical protein